MVSRALPSSRSWPMAQPPPVMPSELVVSTVAAARLSVALGPAAKAFLSARVVNLTQGVLHSMVLTKVKIAIAVLFVLGIAALGAGGLISSTLATEPAAGMPEAHAKGPGEPGRTARTRR